MNNQKSSLVHTPSPWPMLQTLALESLTHSIKLKPAFNAVFEGVQGQISTVTMSAQDYEHAQHCVALCEAHTALPVRDIQTRTKSVLQTIYCIALDGDQITGCNWYYTDAHRKSCLGSTGAEIETCFNKEVPSTASREEIDAICDLAAWDKEYVVAT